MPTRRPRDKRTFGEISQLPSGRYRARLRLPGGERVAAPITFVARMDAERWVADQEREISRGDWQPPQKQAPAPRANAQGSSTLLADYVRQVIIRRRLRPTTAALYEKLMRLAIHPTFGHRTLGSITPDEVSAWFETMRHTPTQQANAYGLLKSILKEAVDDELITRNPCRVRSGSQKQPAKHIEILTIRQVEQYLEAVPAARRAPLMLAAWCGLRSGEVRGLRVKDLDLDHGVVHVRQAVVRLKGRLLIVQPKTRAGVRSVSIPPHLIPALRACLQPSRSIDALLFPAGDGVTPMNDSVLREAHDKGKAAVGIPGLTIHALRHTSATMAAQLGATIAELQARIGHSTPSMAMRYQHVAADRDAQLAARMSEVATSSPLAVPAERRPAGER